MKETKKTNINKVKNNSKKQKAEAQMPLDVSWRIKKNINSFIRKR